jgi:carboxypeptidase Taq
MMMELFNQFKAYQKKLKAYGMVLTIASWDSNTEAPKACFPHRADLLSLISGEYFSLQTSKTYVELVNGLNKRIDELDDTEKKEVKKAKKDLDKIIKIPKDEYVEYAKLINLSQRVWEEAKENDDYSHFKPYLEKIIAAKKRQVAYRSDRKDKYNILLDDFEEGMTMELYDNFFNTIKNDLVPFVKEVLDKKKERRNDFVHASYDIKKQKQFVEYLIDVFNFDLDRGRLKESVHPFTWNTHSQDVRFTVNYVEKNLFSSIFAGIHELGHALYEQQIDPILDMTNLNGGTSMGIHESQSRFYENIIGRSKAFWEAHFEQLKVLFPEQLNGVTIDDFYHAINNVEETFIRIEADELTYPLHILIRYEIERMIFDDDIDLNDLPTIWNERIQAYLNITPKNDKEGILQDVHWSAGMFGYFPTYALGSAYAAQIYYTMKKELNIDALIKDNNIKAINEWLKEKIHCYGSTKKPLELLEEVTKEPFNPSYYVQYLKEKYSSLL